MILLNRTRVSSISHRLLNHSGDSDAIARHSPGTETRRTYSSRECRKVRIAKNTSRKEIIRKPFFLWQTNRIDLNSETAFCHAHLHLQLLEGDLPRFSNHELALFQNESTGRTPSMYNNHLRHICLLFIPIHFETFLVTFQSQRVY